jgi:hypothetical protein
VERSYRGRISDVDPLPARLNVEAQCGALRSLWLNPVLCGSPVYGRGAKSGKRNLSYDSYSSFGIEIEILQLSPVKTTGVPTTNLVG